MLIVTLIQKQPNPTHNPIMRATGATPVHVPVIVLVPTVLVADAAAQVPDNAPVYPELQVGAHGVAPKASVAL